MNKQQSAALAEMQQSASVFHVYPARTAQALIDGGYARLVDIDPMPDESSLPISITALGRGVSTAEGSSESVQDQSADA